MRFGNVVRRGLIVGLAAVIAAGCQTLDPYTGQERVSKTAKGAGIGAVAGAVAGILTGDDSRERRKRALIGAGVGALAGGAVGQYMDRQEAKLRAQLEGTGVRVVRDGNNITLSMPGNITFATDSADLRPDFFDVLNSVALVLKEYDKTLIEVAGHTDSTGSDQYNQVLSERRAASVAQYLQSQGVNPQRIITVGAGEKYPIAPNDTPEGRQANRRVELSLEPITAT
ncbi:MAG: OmpA family protein [Pseudomonadota bacterium]|jgi:Outer membrane protein and related peptidoglycan-associated (lipo)proteins|nr:MAG: cell envelope biogenesis protein OmpA [Pseudomonadota bacterium]